LHENRVKHQEKKAALLTRNEGEVVTVVRVKIAEAENAGEVGIKVLPENRRKTEENQGDEIFSEMMKTISKSKLQVKPRIS